MKTRFKKWKLNNWKLFGNCKFGNWKLKQGLLAAISFILVSFSGVIMAQGPQIGVSPPIFELNVERGQTLEQKVKVYNPGDMPLPIHVRPTDFTADENSGQILFDESASDISFASRFWFKIDNSDFILEPKEIEEIKFSIMVPDNAEPGGHYATLMLEPQLPSFYFEEDKPRVIPYVGILFLLSVNVDGIFRPEFPLTVVEFNIPEKFHLKPLENFIASVSAAENNMFSILGSSNLSFVLRIKNNDIFHIKPSGKLSIFSGKIDENASRLDEKRSRHAVEITKTTILPGKTRDIPVEFIAKLPEGIQKYLPAFIAEFISSNLMWGKYTAVLELEGKPLESMEFWVLPWKTGLSTIFVLFIIMFLTLKYRKRIKSAIHALISGGPTS